MEPTSELPPDVIAALEAGRKIEAIRLLCAHRGLGLKQAKELIDQKPAMRQSGIPSLKPLQPENGVGQVIKVAIILGIVFVAVRILMDQ